MTKPTPRRTRAAVVALMLVTSALGMTLAVLVAGSASAASSKTTTTKKKTTTTTTKKATPAKTSTVQTPTTETTTTESPGDGFFVINGTVNAASDHEIVGSSAFPNFTTGAVDNYYSMAHSHVDNSPFAEGTASPADTGPIGQTAAAGQFQQPQYADARWPGDKDSGKATYGKEGQPYATAEAGEYRATADASEATNGLAGPGLNGKKTLALPKGFDLRLKQALGGWRAKWGGRLGLKNAAPAVNTPAGPLPKPKPPVTVPKSPVPVPKPKVTTPTATVQTPLGTVTTPTPRGAVGDASPVPPVTVPAVTMPSSNADGSRSLASLQTSQSSQSADDSPPADGEWLLTSSTSASLVRGPDKIKKADTAKTGATTTTTKAKSTAKPEAPKPVKSYSLVTSGESTLGRVSLAGGQIVIHHIHVTASITNDGTPTYKAAVSVASATIGGVPVTIDQDGVHVAGQGGALPYQQASDALNTALKQAGIQLFLVGPEVTTCGGQTGTGDTGTDSGTTTSSSTTTTSSDQSGASSSCDQGGSTGSTCDQSDSGSDGSGAPGLPGSSTTTSSDQSSTTDTTSSSCGDQTGGMCDQAGTGTTGTTTTSAAPALGGQSTTTTTGRTTTTSSRQAGSTTTTSTTSTTSSCSGSGLPSTGSCTPTGTTGGTPTTSSDQSSTTTMPSSGDAFGFGGGMSNAGEMTVTATGVHVVFTQPMSPPGVPAQYVEHILGEVFVDSLAAPATDTGNLDLSSGSGSFGSSSSSSSSCLGGGHSGGAASGASASGGGVSAGGSGAAGSLSSSASGATSESGSGSTGTSLPAAFAAALRKPLWLLLAYLVWQALVIGTGASLWNWRREET